MSISVSPLAESTARSTDLRHSREKLCWNRLRFSQRREGVVRTVVIPEYPRQVASEVAVIRHEHKNVVAAIYVELSTLSADP